MGGTGPRSFTMVKKILKIKLINYEISEKNVGGTGPRLMGSIIENSTLRGGALCYHFLIFSQKYSSMSEITTKVKWIPHLKIIIRVTSIYGCACIQLNLTSETPTLGLVLYKVSLC